MSADGMATRHDAPAPKPFHFPWVPVCGTLSAFFHVPVAASIREIPKATGRKDRGLSPTIAQPTTPD